MLRTTAALLALASTATAQQALTFDVDTAATAFTYSGTTSLGPLVGNPPNFSLVGAADGVLLSDPAVGPTSVQFVAGSDALVQPDISAEVPAILPFFPPSATVDITNLRLQFTSPPAAVTPASGSFSTMLTTTAISGTATVATLATPPTVLDLAGTTGDPTAVMGNVLVDATGTTVTVTLQATFSFTDPGSGATADITLDGTVVARVPHGAATGYCTSNPNSSGASAVLSGSGSSSLTLADLTLDATGMPPSQFCLFFFGDGDDFVPGFAGSEGNLCVGGSLFRLNNFIQSTGATGTASLAVPFTGLPTGASIDPGETWYYQTWFRDVVGGVQTSNTTTAVEVTFTP
ncbi:MAG: hypothetical protein AAFP86_10145 [Planctomycetota bacterium]